MSYHFEKTNIEGLYQIMPAFFEDHRGILKKTFEQKIFEQNGIDFAPKEEIETTSYLGVLRGLHFQTKNAQAKLVRVAVGHIFDVVVDTRKDSVTYGQVFYTNVSSENKKMLYVPAGCAHGCLVLNNKTVFYYLCSQLYEPNWDSGIFWNDPALAIPWPVKQVPEIIVSEKDKQLPLFSEL